MNKEQKQLIKIELEKINNTLHWRSSYYIIWTICILLFGGLLLGPIGVIFLTIFVIIYYIVKNGKLRNRKKEIEFLLAGGEIKR